MRPTPTIDTILADGAFFCWAQQEEGQNADSINLYNAILDYESKLTTSSTPQLSIIKLARHIHRKYVSLNTGSCHVIDDSTRTKMSSRIHELLDGQPPYLELFEPLKEFLIQHLQCMYAQFTTSDAAQSSEPSKNLWRFTSSSSTSSSNTNNSKNSETKPDSDWLGDEKPPRLDITNTALSISHDNETSRFEFYNAVCTKLNSLQETSNSSSEILQSPKMSPYGAGGFAPPPMHTLERPKVLNLPRRFESLYRKKQQNATSDSSGFGSGASEIMGYSKFATRVINNGFSTLQAPRRRPIDPPSTTSPPRFSLELRYENDIPMIAKISKQPVTFRHFRHIFGVQSHENCRYFFKSTSEDGTSVYQWTLIFRDDEIVPVFQDRITALCRMCPEVDV